MAPPGALLLDDALGGLGEAGNARRTALLGQRIAARAGELSVGERLLPRLGERDQGDAAEPALALAAPNHAVCPASCCSPLWPRARMVFVRSDPNRQAGPLRPAAHTSRQLLCFRFSPFAARSGGSANPVGLLSRCQRPDPPRRPVRERHRDQHLRLACQHPGQPRIRDLAAPARLPNNGHGSRDQEPPEIALAQRST